ncbi:MAG: HEAT repeat domain-containing protein [Nostoc sp. ChiSLP02]|nr:HEAT repeat domain-containing protein [Nostoc sp. DedSLP05]MDZ8103020.1 HEAT repeat domain-containing protein [Nostoc sp. DedSLP01]MDZ8183423.1 HEAT repeat domain-containing protein [Nostoc sp. ChiSLP02]
MSTTAIWAILWLTSAKTCHSYTTYTFADEELDILRQVIINEKHDAFARSWSALILSVCTPEKTIFAQADWIYEWAIVADGGKPQRKLPKVSYLNRLKDIEVMKKLIFSHLPIKAKRYVAIALGRLGCFLPEIIDPLLQVFQDDMCTSDERDEALVYLVFTGNSQVISALIYGVNRPKDDTDKYGLPERCFLALIGMGNVDALQQQIELGIKNQIDINALAYALAGVSNPQGRKVLESMKNHREKEVRNAVINALRKSTQWDS